MPEVERKPYPQDVTDEEWTCVLLYRRITALLVHAGWKVGKDRVERIW